MDARLRRAWKANSLKAIADYPEASPADIKMICRIIDLGFLTLSSQYGRTHKGPKPLNPLLYSKVGLEISDKIKNGEITSERKDQLDSRNVNEAYKAQGGKFATERATLHTERAYISGYMRRKQAYLLWNAINQTDKVCLLEGMYIPVTYSSVNYKPETQLNEWDVSEELTGQIFPETSIGSAHRSGGKRDLEQYVGKSRLSEFVHVTCFDPVHGRSADKSLFPLVIQILENIGK
jgi:hypothetical protein